MTDEDRLARLCGDAEEALEAGDLDEALRLVDEALAVDPDDGPAMLLKTEALFVTDERDEALELAERCAKANADDPWLLVQVATLLAHAAGDDAEVAFQALGHLARAEELAKTEADPLLFSEIERARGRAYASQGDLVRATATLEKARSLAGDEADDDLLFELALAWFETLRFAEARALAEEVLRRDADHPDALHLAGLVAEREGDPARAESFFAKARALDAETYPEPVRLTDEEFEAAVEEALEEIPDRVRRCLANTPIIVEPLPSLDDLKGPPPLSPQSLGLFKGDLAPGGAATDRFNELPSEIHLYRKNLERLAADRHELVDEIRTTLFHEVGHFLGWDEDEVDRHGLH